jgi:sulfate transport system ATP-binding protein
MGIRVTGVTKQFGAFRAVDSVSLDVESGSLVVLLGPSGSGKSTLLRLIAGLEDADEGRIWITGEETTSRSVQDRHVGLVFQHFALARCQLHWRFVTITLAGEARVIGASGSLVG